MVCPLASDIVHQPDAADDPAAAMKLDDNTRRFIFVTTDTNRYVADQLIRDVGYLPCRMGPDRTSRQFKELWR
jgi:hypothetical protein